METGEDPVVELTSDNTNSVVGGCYIHEAGTNAIVAFTDTHHCSIGSAFTVENAGSSLFFSDSEESFSLYKIGE